jgi:hypothetical protein
MPRIICTASPVIPDECVIPKRIVQSRIDSIAIVCIAAISMVMIVRFAITRGNRDS